MLKSLALLPRTVVTAVATLGITVGALSAAAPAQAAQDLIVNPAPDQSQPRIMNGRVFGIDSAGPLVVTGGSFDTIRQGDSTGERTQQWLFMFNRETGRIVDSFAPQLGGPTPSTSGLVAPQPGVQAVQFAEDGQSIYIAGDFTSVNGTEVKRIAQVDLQGNLITSFNAEANLTVNDMALTGGRLIVAGRFGKLNNQPVERLGSLDPSTGALQTDFNLPATESRYEFAPYVQEIDASDDGRWLAVIGNFQKLGTRSRNQVGLIDLTGTADPSVANWVTDAYAGDCASVYDDSWARGVDISPASDFMVISSTGAYRGKDSFCDTAVRWELPSSDTFVQGNQKPTWRNLTGGDTLWANEITESAAYVGGHQRWMNNPTPSPGGDNDGPGSVERYGIAALDPVSGAPLSFNPGRARGRGIEAMHVADQQLFLGNDTDLFGGEIRQRMAVLSTAGGTANPAPEKVDLPVRLYARQGNNLVAANFDGTSFGTPSNASGGINWSDLRGGFVQNGALHYFGGQGAFYRRSFSGSSFGSPTNLSTSVGYVDTNRDLTPYDQPYGVDTTQVAAYYNGRIYYRKGSENTLYSRGYSLESGIIGSHEQRASTASWQNARSIAFAGDWLYAAWNDGKLYRFYAPDGRIKADTRQLVDSGASGIDWNNASAMFMTREAGTANPPATPNTTCDSSTPWQAERWNNQSLDGAPVETVCEAQAGENYGQGGVGSVGPDNFSIRWTRTITVTEAQSVRIDALSDDGVRAYVDGDLILDGWKNQAATAYTGTSQALAPGDHLVTVEYYENGGDARIETDLTLVDPVIDQGPDNTAGDTTVDAPAKNAVVSPAGQVTIAGTATDDRATQEIRVAVLDRNASTNKWLQPDGSTFGSAYNTLPILLDTPGETSSTWSGVVNLPVGEYAIIARSVDAAGNVDQSSVYQPFSVSSTEPPAPDTENPAVSVDSPTGGQQFGSSSVGASGTATDNRGIERVRVGVYNRDDANNRWLQDNGSFGPQFNVFTADLGSPGAASTTWNLPAKTLPDGRYAFDVRAFDTSGNRTPSSIFRPFEVNTTPDDTQAPTVTVTTPAVRSTQTTNPTQATGTAADNLGVAEVRVAVYNRSDATNRWLQPDGTWGPQYNYYPANLNAAGSTSTDWSLPLNLPTGEYAVDVKSRDAKGNLSPSAYRPFSVQIADSSAPQTRSAPSLSRTTSEVSAKSLLVKGTATDNQALRTVDIAVQKKVVKKRNGKTKTVKRWLKPNGKWGSKRQWVKTSISADLAKKVTWKKRFRLSKKGTYKVLVRAVDVNGNLDRTPVKQKFVVKR